MANPDRLSALDSSFLHLEKGGAHMHVASVLVFSGTPPSHEGLIEAIESRLHMVPRYRQKLAFVPLDQGRPRWIDDPHFNPAYHIRHTALPSPGGEREMARLAGRLFAQPLDRSKPLWEIWLVEGLDTDRFALMCKTHHALVDGVSGVDLLSVLFRLDPDDDDEIGQPPAWIPRPVPSAAQLLAEALAERATAPREALRGLRALTRAPREASGRLFEGLVGLGAMARAGFSAAPPSPLNVPIGPHRRYGWIDADLNEFKAIKNGLTGTINDAVLAAVTLALGRWLRDRGEPTEGLVLKAMVPVSVRAETEQGALGNRVSNLYAPLPVGLQDPAEVFAYVHDAMRGLKESGQAVGAQAITQLADFAPPTILNQAARLQARQRFFNLVVTNVPGPQFPLYLLGRRLEAVFPVVPLAKQQALGIAQMSYNGRLGFGLNADFDAVPDLDSLRDHLEDAIADLAKAAGARPPRAGRRQTAVTANGRSTPVRS